MSERTGDQELLVELQGIIVRNDRAEDHAGNPIVEGVLSLPTARLVDLIKTAVTHIRFVRGAALDRENPEDLELIRSTFPLTTVTRFLVSLERPFTIDDLKRLLIVVTDSTNPEERHWFPTDKLADHLARFAGQPDVAARWAPELSLYRQQLSGEYSSGMTPDHHYGSNYAMDKLAAVMNARLEGFVERGDDWVDAALSDLDSTDEAARTAWRALLDHAGNSNDSKPKPKWQKAAAPLLEAVGTEQFLAHVQRWFALYGKDDGYWFADREERNDAYFKGLVWFADLVAEPAVIAALGAALRGSFKARGRAGVRSLKVANACIFVLGNRSESEAAAHLVNGRLRAKNGAILKTLEKTIEAVAARAGMTAADLEELSVPDFGVEDGALTQQFGAASVRIDVSGAKAIWQWKSDGKPAKSVPAAVKRDFAAELKELKAAALEVEKTIAAQKDRLDGLLRIEKTWDFATWKARYLDHPLMRNLVGRLIWTFEFDGAKTSAVPRGEAFVDARNELVQIPDTATVSLYHPLFDTSEGVLQWRRHFEDSEIKQPFKQAHRELYLLTDAERATRIYSNRYASHILKQHQFNQLCAARGWKNQLRLMVDDEYPPAVKTWPHHGLRAEFWIEGAGTEYETDATETGTYFRVATDQVRFYPLDAPRYTAHAGGGGYRAPHYQGVPQAAEPLELSQVPPLVFSETMRDVDLFVGVASLGADPDWSDGGPEGRFRAYWADYSWGELSESAASRADVLSRLLPRLKIKDRAAIDGRFLRVEGKRRTYKIHLGSGNILMEPNDQYLCIVPSSSGNGEIFLPFEGDRTLALIVSKALLLSDDDKITDASINSQIGG